MHPFDLRTAVFAKHAQHVVLIHFPIALFIAGVVFDFLAQWKKQPLLAAASYYNFFAAALATIPVLITGILAWQWQLEGQRLKGVLLMHLVLGTSTSLLIWLACLVHMKGRRKPDMALPSYRWLIEVLAVALVTVTGHLGGFLSGVNSPG